MLQIFYGVVLMIVHIWQYTGNIWNFTAIFQDFRFQNGLRFEISKRLYEISREFRTPQGEPDSLVSCCIFEAANNIPFSSISLLIFTILALQIVVRL